MSAESSSGAKRGACGMDWSAQISIPIFGWSATSYRDHSAGPPVGFWTHLVIFKIVAIVQVGSTRSEGPPADRHCARGALVPSTPRARLRGTELLQTRASMDHQVEPQTGRISEPGIERVPALRRRERLLRLSESLRRRSVC